MNSTIIIGLLILNKLSKGFQTIRQHYAKRHKPIVLFIKARHIEIPIIRTIE